MYPKEDEVLFPPMCACEVQKTRIEGSVVFVELRPGVAACELQEVSLEQMEKEKILREARRTEEEAKRKAAIEDVAKTRAKWMSSMTSVRTSAANAKRATQEARAAQAEADAASEKDRALKLEQQKAKLEERVAAMEELQKTMLEEAKLAEENRVKALEAKNVMSRAQSLAMYMKAAALKAKLTENEITLKALCDAQNGRGKILSKFKAGLSLARLEAGEDRVLEMEAKVEQAMEEKAALQVRFDEAHVRTLAAEDKVGKLQKELAGVKKMLDTLMK